MSCAWVRNLLLYFYLWRDAKITECLLQIFILTSHFFGLSILISPLILTDLYFIKKQQFTWNHYNLESGVTFIYWCHAIVCVSSFWIWIDDFIYVMSPFYRGFRLLGQQRLISLWTLSLLFLPCRIHCLYSTFLIWLTFKFVLKKIMKASFTSECI